ncbi:hypothetical protein ACTFIY_002595 [Dictyostelium cf. discoideum]
MEFEQDYKAIDELITWFMSAPTPSNSTNNIGTSTTKNISKTTTLMCKKRNLKPMNEGGWGMWHIQFRQTAQKIWIFNRFLSLQSLDNTATYVKHSRTQQPKITLPHRNQNKMGRLQNLFHVTQLPSL